MLQRQLLLFGKVSRMLSTSIVRGSVFVPGSNDIANPSRKRQGGQRNIWATELSKQAKQLANGGDLDTLLANGEKWKTEIVQFVRQADH